MPPDPPNQDVVSKSIGVLGRWHIWICFCIFLSKFPVGWHQIAHVFLSAPVNFTCSDPNLDQCSPDCPRHEFDRSVFTGTIQTEWDLVCENRHLANLSQTITMLGVLVGNMVFGIISDKYGRRGPLVVAVIIQAFSGTGAAFSPWYWLYVVFRFLVAIATGGTMITSFVLIMEIVGTKWRTTVGTVFQIPFYLGHLTLALIGYFLRNWRHFQLAISVPSFILTVYYWILPESPRYLLAVGKSEEAINMLEAFARHNKLPTDNIRDDVNAHISRQGAGPKRTGKMLDLFKTSALRNRTICISFNWVVCGLCYFGVAQYIGQFAGNTFMNVAISAFITIPGTFASLWGMNHLGRKITLIASDSIAGIACLLINVTPTEPPWPRALLGTMGMFGLSMCFATVYIYAGELYPTVIRNVGVGFCSMLARIGSMLAPFVASFSEIRPWIPPTAFGVVPLIGAFLCLFLPETVDCKLPDTIEEAERLGKEDAT